MVNGTLTNMVNGALTNMVNGALTNMVNGALTNMVNGGLTPAPPMPRVLTLIIKVNAGLILLFTFCSFLG